MVVNPMDIWVSADTARARYETTLMTCAATQAELAITLDQIAAEANEPRRAKLQAHADDMRHQASKTWHLAMRDNVTGSTPDDLCPP